MLNIRGDFFFFNHKHFENNRKLKKSKVSKCMKKYRKLLNLCLIVAIVMSLSMTLMTLGLQNEIEKNGDILVHIPSLNL